MGITKIFLAAIAAMIGLTTYAHAGAVHCYTEVTVTSSDFPALNKTLSFTDIVGGDDYANSWKASAALYLSGLCMNVANKHGADQLIFVSGPIPNQITVKSHAYYGFGNSIQEIAQTGNYADLGIVFSGGK